jgi:hypothetical protein
MKKDRDRVIAHETLIHTFLRVVSASHLGLGEVEDAVLETRLGCIQHKHEFYKVLVIDRHVVI